MPTTPPREKHSLSRYIVLSIQPVVCDSVILNLQHIQFLSVPFVAHFGWLGLEVLSVAWSTGAQLIIFFCFRFSVVLFDRPGISSVLQHIVSVESSSLLLHSYLI